MKKIDRISTYQLTLIGLMTALLCVMGPLTLAIPFTPVPVSLTSLAVFLTVWLLGWKLGTVTYLIYLLLGLVGLPVFSGFSGGAGILLGPTGGYLIGFVFLAVISGVFIEKWKGRGVTLAGMRFLGMAIGTVVNYLFGTFWLSKAAQMNLAGALGAGVLPFLPGDLVKIILVATVAPKIEMRMIKAGLLK